MVTDFNSDLDDAQPLASTASARWENVRTPEVIHSFWAPGNVTCGTRAAPRSRKSQRD